MVSPLGGVRSLGVFAAFVLAAAAGCGDDASSPAGSGGSGGSGASAPTSGSEGNGGDGSGGDGATVTASGPSGSGGGASVATGTGGGEVCTGLDAMDPCDAGDVCCDGRVCDVTSLGQVCCGGEGIACATEGGEDCCGNLLCVEGQCGYDVQPEECTGPCNEAPALKLEKYRLQNIGGTFLGICGDANHTYGFHVPAANLPADDYSMEGEANEPVCEWEAAAIDIGMDWPVSRDWLRWLIEEIREERIVGVAEVIGSYDGVDVRYWADWSGWETDGEPYGGEGHDSHTHVSIYRSTTHEDHGILLGWRADGGPASP